MDKDICPACGKENTYETYLKVSEDETRGLYMCECGHVIKKNKKKLFNSFPLLTEIKMRMELKETKEEIYKDLTNEQKEQYKEELERLYDIVNNIIIPGWQGFVKSIENMKNIIGDNWPWDI